MNSHRSFGKTWAILWAGILLLVAVCEVSQAVPFFSQRDSRWKNEQMGSSSCTIGTCGCAMTDVAMILKHAGADVDPKKLNSWLGLHGGYTASGAIYWAKAADYDGSGGVIYRGSNNTWNNWNELSSQLSQGRLVIVKVDAYLSTPQLEPHWVLVTEKIASSTSDPYSYSINDPWDLTYTPKTLGHYYDTVYHNTFFAMRYYSGPFSSVAPPSPPTPTSPGTSSGPGPVIDNLTPTLRWNGSSGADHYALAISKYPYGSSNIVYNPQILYGTSVTVPSGELEYGHKYRWNMQARNSAGPSGVSSTLYFQTPPSPPAYVVLTLYVHEGSASGPAIAGARVQGHDATGNSFDHTANSSGYVTITGAPGSWHFVASKSGYQTNTWDQSISETCTRQSYLQREQPSCTYTISPSGKSFNYSGGSGSFNVTTSRSDCQWTAQSDSSWITITSTMTSGNDGVVYYTVTANSGSVRTGHITVEGHQYTISQAAASSTCTYSISPSGKSFNYSGGSGSFNVTTSRSDCQWTAQSDSSWITITSTMTSGNDGVVYYTVTANSGSVRTGHITVEGQQYTISQVAAPSTCTYSISPSGKSFDHSSGSGSFTVTASRSDCQWTAQSDNNWITITGTLTSGSSGTVYYTVSANSGPARTGHITVEGQQYTISQAAALSTCTYMISPTSQSFGASGGSGSFNVTTSRSDCAWTAQVSYLGPQYEYWITITSGSSGTGSGTVYYTVSANSGPRTGYITVEGQRYTINQAVATAALQIVKGIDVSSWTTDQIKWDNLKQEG